MTNNYWTVLNFLSQQTPMHTAAKDGNEFTMKGLRELGAYINIEDKNGVSEFILLMVDLFEFQLAISQESTMYALFVHKQATPNILLACCVGGSKYCFMPHLPYWATATS